jgi:Holliday junction DNA helicase RuvA
MRVLGIDPGSLITGFGVVEDDAQRLRALTWGAVRTTARQPLYRRLQRIYEGLSEAMETWQPDAVSVERVFFAENPKTALTLGQARGGAHLNAARPRRTPAARRRRRCARRRHLSSAHAGFTEAYATMIARLHGMLVTKEVGTVIVDVQGVGYQVFIPLSTYYTLPDPQQAVTLLTTLYVREDALRLYGFATSEEQELFELLVSVSSVGPRLALNMLSNLAAPDLQQAIAREDLARLRSIPGVGRKTAERVILELKDKAALVAVTAGGSAQTPVAADDRVLGDVISALLNLGYKRAEADKAVRAVQARYDGEAELETLLKEALRVLAR